MELTGNYYETNIQNPVYSAIVFKGFAFKRVSTGEVKEVSKKHKKKSAKKGLSRKQAGLLSALKKAKSLRKEGIKCNVINQSVVYKVTEEVKELQKTEVEMSNFAKQLSEITGLPIVKIDC
jgi:hypothetical protein